MRPQFAEQDLIEEGLLEMLDERIDTGGRSVHAAGAQFSVPGSEPAVLDDDVDDDWGHWDDWNDYTEGLFDDDYPGDAWFDDYDPYYDEDPCYDPYYDDVYLYEYEYLAAIEPSPFQYAPAGMLFWQLDGFEDWFLGTFSDVVSILAEGVYSLKTHGREIDRDAAHVPWADL